MSDITVESTNIQEKIFKTIHNLMASKSNIEPLALNVEVRFIEDLHFRSMDFAELIANLEMEFDVDPFSTWASIADIKSIKDVIDIYAKEVSQ